MKMTVNIRSAFTDITPPTPCFLAGYNDRPLPFASIHDPIEANIIRIGQEGKKLYLVSIDTLFTSREFKLQVISHFNSASGENVREEDMFMIASHTHFAPTLDRSKPVIGKADESYIAFTRQRIVEALLRLEKQPAQAAHIVTSEVKAPFSINRRRRIIYRDGISLKRKVMLGPNRSGKASEDLTLIRFEDSAGKAIAIAWHYACHPTDFYKHNSLSAGFPGIVRKKLRAKAGEVPVVYLQGFAGDLKPWDHAHMDKGKKVKEILLRAEAFPVSEEATFNQWAQGLADCALLAFSQTGEKTKPFLKSTVLEGSLAHLFKKHPPADDVFTLQEISLGENLKVIGMSFEPLIQYEELVRSVYPEGKTLCCGYTDSVYVYLPASQQVKEGGYECDGFMQKFSYPGEFSQKPEDQVLVFLRKLKQLSS